MFTRALYDLVSMPLGLALAALVLALAGPVAAQDVALEELDALEFRHIGPVGNRMSSAAGIPGNPDVYYVGAAAGGIWKTTDAGLHWKPVFDGQDAHAVGALAVAPSDPKIVWAGTGEPHIRSNSTIGDGVYRSMDGGESWAHVGLPESGRISSIQIHPYDPDIVYVAALGHVHGSQEERGVYRTTDGGETWERILHTGPDAGASDVVMDPNNPRKLFAGMWQVEFNTWNRHSGGPQSGLFVSRDGGDSWTKLEGSEIGLPDLPVGKVGVCMTPADSDRVYALIETGDGVPGVYRDVPGAEGVASGEAEPESGDLWRSDDGGRTWELVQYSRDMGARTAYYNRCAVSTDDPDEVYFLAHDFFRSLDGGHTYTEMAGESAPGWDDHAMWIDPTNADRMIVASDGGVGISENRGRTWLRKQPPVAQMYHVTVDDMVPYHVLGNRQDGPSMRGPSRSRFGDGIPRSTWHEVGGGESGFATPVPGDPETIWSSASGAGAGGGIVVLYDHESRQYREVTVWPESTIGWPVADLRYRFQWTFPLEISPHDPSTVYVTSQHVHRTRNGGQSWEVVSPDLTTDAMEERGGFSGGLTPDNIGVEYCCVIYAFDESPAREGVLWAGSNDGLVHVSRDGGESWTEVTDNIPEMPVDGVVRAVDASKWEAGKAYLAVEAHQVGDFTPYVYRTEDFGQSWERITDGIDDSPLSFTRWIHEDPRREGLVYLGTENELYVTFDDGESWQSLMTNLPPAPMYGLIVQEHFNDLVVGTYGRGFWILDDLTPLQQLTSEVASSETHLFEPRRTYRFQPITPRLAMTNDPSIGENPPDGAPISYWLGREPEGAPTVRIRNEAGDVIRTLDGTSEQGMNRIWWDLEESESLEMVRRVPPLHADWVEMEEDGTRRGGAEMAILAPPGAYTVELEVDGETTSRSLELVKDPNSEGSLSDIREQTAMLREIQADLEEAVRMINRLEVVRAQAGDLKELAETDGLPDGADTEGLVAEIDALDRALVSVEERLLQLKTTGTAQDGVRWPSMLAGRLESLAGDVAVADYPPTDQAREVHRVLRERLADVRSDFDAVIAGEVADFNAMLRQRGLSTIVAGQE